MKTSTLLIVAGLGYYLMNKDKVNTWLQDKFPPVDGGGNMNIPVPVDGGGYDPNSPLKDGIAPVPVDGGGYDPNSPLKDGIAPENNTGVIPVSNDNMPQPQNNMSELGGYPAHLGNLPANYSLIIDGNEANFISLPIKKQRIIKEHFNLGERTFSIYTDSGKELIEIVKTETY